MACCCFLTFESTEVGHVRRIDFTVEDLRPITASEEWVGLKLLNVAHPQIRVALEKLSAQVTPLWGKLFC